MGIPVPGLLWQAHFVQQGTDTSVALLSTQGWFVHSKPLSNGLAHRHAGVEAAEGILKHHLHAAAPWP